MTELTHPSVSLNGTARIEIKQKRPRGRRFYWIAAAAVVVIVALVVAFLVPRKAGARAITAPVTRKTLTGIVTATGTVNPQDTIDIGTQVSGTIQSIYTDYNAHVYEGEVLARLDPTPFQASVDQAESSLAQARANYQGAIAAQASAQTSIAKDDAALGVAQLTVNRDKALLVHGYIAQSQGDTDQSNLVAARSALSSAQDQANQAASQALGDQDAVSAAQAQLQQAQLNLDHSIITSPVDGTVIARNVSVGQTVAASFQTPTLFTIAKDLGKMEVDLAVGEPDIGSVRAGQPVSFTVLAYPNYTFHGSVAQVRENPTTVQNVVTYDTVVYVKNPRGMLRPGMTASASIQTAEAANALVVPLAALSVGSYTHGGAGASSSSPWGDTGTAATQTIVAGTTGRVMVIDGGKLRPVPVEIALLSGGEAAVRPIGNARLQPGSQVVVALASHVAQTAGGGSNTTTRAMRMFH
jgi:HlyD family secretion protein